MNDDCQSKFGFGVINQRPDPRDWCFEIIHHAFKPATPRDTTHPIFNKAKQIWKSMDSELPIRVDYRPDMLPVREQGIANSSLAFACASIKEWQEKQDCGFKGYMSPAFIYRTRRNFPEAGMTVRDALDILLKRGIPSEYRFPYVGKDEDLRSVSEDTLAEARNFRIEGYAFVNTIDGAKRALITYGPLLIIVPAYNYGWRMWASGIHSSCLGLQAMCIVGYNQVGFILRNSWGQNWADNGHTLFPFEDFGCQVCIVSTVDVVGSKPLPRPVPIEKKEKRVGCFSVCSNSL